MLLINAFWNNGAGMSGGDQMLIQVFGRIRASLGRVWCLTNVDGQHAVGGNIPDVEFYVAPKWFDKMGVLISYVLRTVVALRCLTLRPNVIYGSSDFFPDVIPAFILKCVRPKTRWVQCVFHIYPDWRKRPGSKLKSIVAQYLQQASLMLIRRADLIVNINHEVKRYLIEYGFNPQRIAINPPGIDVNYFRKVHLDKSIPQFDGVFLGRLNPSKGIFDLPEIWRRVVVTLPDAHLAIIGGGSQAINEQLKKRIEASGVTERIVLLGFLDSDRAFEIIKASKLFLFPSHEEGFGIVIVEALACGVPVVAWNLSVFDELFNGMISTAQIGDLDAFASRVVEGILNRSNLSESCDPDSLQRFSWDTVSQNTLRILGASQ